MNTKDLENFINEHISLISTDAKSLIDARDRAAKFLVAQSVLATFLRDFEDDKTRLTTLKEIAYAKAIKVSDGKNITEKKVNVYNDSEYNTYNEAVETMDHARDYIKTHIKIFENSHLFFRQMSKE